LNSRPVRKKTSAQANVSKSFGFLVTSRGCCRRRLFGCLGPLFLAFEITFAASAFLNFVALSSHISFALRWRGCFVYRAKNMNSPRGRFNLILVLLFCASLGCSSTDSKKEKQEADKSKQATLMRFHVEANPDPTGTRTTEVSIGRSNLERLTILSEPVLDEGFIKKAEVVDADDMGGYAIKITFDEYGTRRLDTISVEDRGRRLAITASWTENRWLAAPRLTKRITNGEFVFTPDATREEADRIVNGLKNVSKKLHENFTF
jgi:phage pi2 protein 07